MIDGICEIIIAIRKDMGHKNTKVKNDDIKKHLLDDYDAAKINGVIWKIVSSLEHRFEGIFD